MLIGCMVANIRAKMFICWLRNFVYSIRSSILEHWRLFCFDWRYCCQDTGENVYSPAFEIVFTEFALLFLEH